MNMNTQAIMPHKNGVILTLYVKPNAKINQFPAEITSNEIVIKVKSPPDKGKANKEVIKTIQAFFKDITPKAELIAGQTSRTKQVLLVNTTVTQVKAKLNIS